MLVLSIIVSCLNLSHATSQVSLNSAAEENSIFSLQASSVNLGVKEHKITSAELGKLKSALGTYQQGYNYNLKVNGHGTGLSPPTADAWIGIAENAQVIESVSSLNLPPAVDNSATPWFPPIGNQGQQGSCATWAVGYYVKTYQEAKEHSWDLSGATYVGSYPGYPSPSYQDKIMSPAFIYNLINGGRDNGTSFDDAINLVSYVGVSSWQKMPYTQSNCTAWPSEAAWTDAPLYRANSTFGYQYLYANTNAGVVSLKNWLAAGNLGLIAVDANQYTYLTSQDIWTTDYYHTVELNHANTIVGYNDSISYTENGTTHYGAFKVANSWGKGSSWEHIADGFYWISYACMKQLSANDITNNNPCVLYQDLVGYQPELLATFRVNHNVRSDCQITFGLGPTSSPLATKKFHNYVFGGAQPFCSNNIVLDITEFKSKMPSQYNQPFYMRVYDKAPPSGTITTGNVTFFGIGTASSSQVPVQTVNNAYVTLNLTYSTAAPTLTVTPASGPPSGAITLNGAGFTTSGSINITWLNPLTSTWIPIGTVATASGNFSYSTTAPDLKQNNPAGDYPPESNNIVFRAQDNSQTINITVPYTEWRRGLSQIGNSAATDLFGNNTDLTGTMFASNGQPLAVVGNWFSPGSVTVLLDSLTSLGNVTVDVTGLLNTTVTMPTTTAGKHALIIRDGGSDFCVTITRLPAILNDYNDDVWHTSDFNVTFAHDFEGIDMFYKINNGSVCNVTANGQPKITVESSNNQLEFWSTWNIYGTGSMEIYHTILTGIKLDKTAPQGSLTSSTYTKTPTVTLALSATDSTSGIAQMRFSNDNTNWSDWEPYATSKTWNLQGSDGQKTVYVQYVDNAGLTSQYSFAITLETIQPTPSPSPTPTPTPSPTPTSPPTQTSTPTPTPTPPIPELNIQTILVMLAVSTLPFAVIYKRKRK